MGIPLDESTIEAAVEKISKSVVGIATQRIVVDTMLHAHPVGGIGSGVILDGGYVMTNNHVVAEAEEFRIVLKDGKLLKGKLVGADPQSDIAVIKVDAKGLTGASLGDSDKLKVGQPVLAVGYPFGLSMTVTSGVVSAIGRHISGEAGTFELIQTDAAINPGNSGGPLVDLRGNVIAISTAIIPYAQGIGFAIPINKARTITEQLIKYGKIKRPWMGVTGLDVKPALNEYYQLGTETGALIAEVVEGSPAARAGLRPGDVIVKFGDKKVAGMYDLLSAIQEAGIGKQVEVQVVRQGKKFTAAVPMREAPAAGREAEE